MDLVDLIAEKKFLGQEFLTWLWWQSEIHGGRIHTPNKGDLVVVFEKHMLLESGEGTTNEKLICSGLETELQEARTGLKMGKKLEQARIQVIIGDYEYNVTLAAALLEFRSVKLPKTAATTPGNQENPEELEGMLLERIFLFEQLVAAIHELLQLFVERRLDTAAWQNDINELRQWVLSHNQ